MQCSGFALCGYKDSPEGDGQTAAAAAVGAGAGHARLHRLLAAPVARAAQRAVVHAPALRTMTESCRYYRGGRLQQHFGRSDENSTCTIKSNMASLRRQSTA